MTNVEVDYVCAVLCLSQLCLAGCVSRADSAVLLLLPDLPHMETKTSVRLTKHTVYLALLMCYAHHINTCSCYWPARDLPLFFCFFPSLFLSLVPLAAGCCSDLQPDTAWYWAEVCTSHFSSSLLCTGGSSARQPNHLSVALNLLKKSDSTPAPYPGSNFTDGWGNMLTKIT